MANGYVKVARKIVEWEWWGDPITLKVFLWCILKANWKEGKFKGVTVPRGSFITSREKGAKECGITEQSFRTAISHLRTTNEITTQSTNAFTLINVMNYELYQGDEDYLTNLLTDKSPASQPTTNQRLTTIEEREEEKELIINKSISKDIDSPSEGIHKDIVEAWNTLADFGISKVRNVVEGSQRASMLSARIKQYGKAAVLEAIDNVKRSQFLQGNNKKGWAINFDWFVKPSNFPKVLEGNYTDKQADIAQTDTPGGRQII